MFLRALFAFLALPGIVAFAVPIWWLVRNAHAGLQHPAALLLLIVGCVGLLWCVRDFYVFGKGTLAPWSPPRHLVTSGLYRYSRNPMYVSVLVILLGWTLTFGALRGLGGYTAIVAGAFYVRVVLFEEPWLARTHGVVWEDYARRVRRWV
ncbi:MAG TPA: isoprenylcysteine carboxylmethyltransferase family protein [Steroidobacteraceae bacterium]|jgi:protein-S-isoprenylcysteine O-methyltransferase Ste14|nr:isoprenylcysteine carboxylmethyltransferase family protein [Steroidobacteraceae bacterium]